jgi:hypothetical protein
VRRPLAFIDLPGYRCDFRVSRWGTCAQAFKAGVILGHTPITLALGLAEAVGMEALHDLVFAAKVVPEARWDA